MKMTAAVMYEQGLQRPFSESQPLKIETIDLDGPGEGEVLVQVAAAGFPGEARSPSIYGLACVPKGMPQPFTDHYVPRKTAVRRSKNDWMPSAASALFIT